MNLNTIMSHRITISDVTNAAFSGAIAFVACAPILGPYRDSDDQFIDEEAQVLNGKLFWASMLIASHGIFLLSKKNKIIAAKFVSLSYAMGCGALFILDGGDNSRAKGHVLNFIAGVPTGGFVGGFVGGCVGGYVALVVECAKKIFSLQTPLAAVPANLGFINAIADAG
ncbi:MAG: hypothetical protein WCF65_06905 [Parachlamydiaceae bacterium]